ncbi:MAG: hypothetical protein GWO38_24645, partial [Phycisphaerae bacterium]|nr:hypothetical protein [Phycisphaerae bacterium]NIX30731.1 hypothetical protein [Phycisphaerae bacterium]
GGIATSRNVADFEPGQIVKANFSINQNLIYLPPGTEIEYWWRLTDAEGNVLKTEPEIYLYLDNRYNFKTLSNDRLSLYWYNGNRSFGKVLFEQAVKALDRLETDVGVFIDRPIKIFIYGTHADLLNALSIGAREWTGGVAFTDQGVVVIGIEPDNLDWGLRAMTHEMTHLVIHQATDNPYGDLPTWLNEGLAVYNEDPDNLNPRYQEILTEAIATDSLFTLRSLSSSFPADHEEASLAYGQSGAIVHFLIDAYEPEAMAKLLEIFSEGAVYDKALIEALGVDTWDLDNAFRASLGLSPLPELLDTQARIQQSSPQEIETRQTDTETEQVESNTEQAESVQPGEDHETSAVRETASEAETTVDAKTAASQTNNRRLQCFAGLLPLAVLGLIIIRRRNLFSSSMQE